MMCKRHGCISPVRHFKSRALVYSAEEPFERSSAPPMTSRGGVEKASGSAFPGVQKDASIRL